jgi:hypothetical protein
MQTLKRIFRFMFMTPWAGTPHWGYTGDSLPRWLFKWSVILLQVAIFTVIYMGALWCVNWVFGTLDAPRSDYVPGVRG